jgi:hypothetical protein
MLTMPLLPLPPSGPRRLNFTVREISGRYDRRRFVRTAVNVYRGDRYWAPGIISERLRALDPKKNPRLAGIQLGLFAAESRTLDEIIGTIAVWAGDRTGEVSPFGMFEVINEREVASSLLEAAESWAQEHLPGAGSLRGPMELDPFRSPGLLVDGYNHRPSVLMPYNLPYYPELIEEAGCEPSTELLAYHLDLSALKSPYGAGEVRSQSEALAVRTDRDLVVRDLKAEPDWQTILPEAGQGSPDTTWRAGPESPEVTTPELLFHLKHIAAWHPSATILTARIGEDGEFLAFGAAVPNTRQAALVTLGKRLTHGWLGDSRAGQGMAPGDARKAGVRLMPVIVRADSRAWGLETRILSELLSRATQQGYATAELSPVPTGDAALRDRLAALGASPYKTYAIYEKRS